jgi:hypothetical protein
MNTAERAMLLLVVQFITQVKVNGVSAWLIQKLKTSQSAATSWISVNTPWVTRFVAFLAAAGTAVGIHATFHGSTLTITGLSATAILAAAWQIGQNYLVQHAWYKAAFKN